MKRTLLISVAVLAFSAGTQAFAQVIEITPEQRTIIREYVIQERLPPANIEGAVRVGVPLAAEVQLAPVPRAWGPQFSRYRYVYWNDRVVLVEPSNRTVVRIID